MKVHRQGQDFVRLSVASLPQTPSLVSATPQAYQRLAALSSSDTSGQHYSLPSSSAAGENSRFLIILSASEGHHSPVLPLGLRSRQKLDRGEKAKGKRPEGEGEKRVLGEGEGTTQRIKGDWDEERGSTSAFGRSVIAWPAEFETRIPLTVSVYWPLSGFR